MAEPSLTAPSLTDDEVRDLLGRYQCPTPFHAARTRFLGNIVSPAMIAPMDTVKGLWGGELPTFDSIDDLNALMAVLVMGLWNRLTRHQERSQPFRLTRPEPVQGREGLLQVARIRREELGGFVEGLFGKEEELDLPERAHRAMRALSEMQAILAGTEEILADASKPATAGDISSTAKHLRELTKIAEHEMHEAVLSCTRARRQLLESLPTTKRTLH